MHRRWLIRVIQVVAVTALSGCLHAAATPAPRAAVVLPGIDVLLRDSSALVRGRRIGLVTNMAAVDAQGTGDIARLRRDGIHLVALFAPEHGLTVQAAPGEHVASGVDSADTPIYSLYGRATAPTDSMLRGIDVVLVDLPDVGARYYTYIATTIGVMQSAAAHHVPVVVLDRPNPVGGTTEGNLLDTAYTSMVGRLPVPMRHGLTLGEEARFAAKLLHIPVTLTIVPVAGWHRSMLFAETGLPFRAPSPNLRTVEAITAYPGTCLFEGTALSVGRGTDAAFLQVGAPWLDTAAVLRALRSEHLAGVTFSAVRFTPHAPGDGKFADTMVAGIRLHVIDPRSFRSVRTAVTLLRIIQHLQPDRLKIGGSFDRLAGGTALREALVRGASADSIVASWTTGLKGYRGAAASALLYGPLSLP